MPSMSVTPEQAARLLRYASPAPEDFQGKPPEGPYCYLCHGWEYAWLNQRAVEEFGATWDKVPDEDGYMPPMYVWEVLHFDPQIEPDDVICVVPRHTIVANMWGTFATRPLVPVHLNCFYIELLNGRRKSGLTERTCRYCTRPFMSRQAIDWCHACEKTGRTCEQCGGPLRPMTAAIPMLGVAGEQRRARSDARYCSGRCRVAAHRAR